MEETTHSESEMLKARSDALERVSDGVVALDDDLRYTYLNRRAANLLDADRERLLGSSIVEECPEFEGSPAHEHVERALDTGQTVTYERYNEILERWFEVHVYPDENGVSIFFQNVSDIKETEQNVAIAGTVFDETQDARFVIDVRRDEADADEAASRYRFQLNRVNPAFERITGLSNEAVVGRTIEDLGTETEAIDVTRRLSECVDRQEPIVFEHETIVPDAGPDWETRIAPVVVEDEVVKLVGAMRNVTQRKRRERELERYRAFVENMSDAIVIIDTDETIDYVSPAAARVFGRDPAELEGGYAFEHVHPDDREAIRENTRELLDTDVETITQRYRFRHADGSWKWVESTAVDGVDDPAIGGILLVTRDVTTHKEREARLDRTLRRMRSLFCGETKDEIATTAMETSRDVLSIPLVGVHLQNGDRLDPVAVTEAVEDRFKEEPTFLESGSDRYLDRIVWDVYESDDALEVPDVSEDDRFPDEMPIGCTAIHPLGDHGVLIAAAPTAGAFDQMDRVLVELLATNLTTALDAIGRERRLERLLKRIQSLFRGTSKEAIATSAMEISRDVLTIPLTGVHFEDDSLLKPVAVSDPVRDRFGSGPAYERSGGDRDVDRLVWDVYESNESLVVPDVREHDRFSPGETPAESAIFHPLPGHGVFIAAAPTAEAFDELDRVLIELLATNLTAALDRELRECRLEDQRDGLEVLNQMMSHDIRNDLQMISAHSESLKRSVDCEGRGSLDTIIASARGATELTQTARDLAEAMLKTDRAREPVPLRTLLETQLEEIRASYETASITVDGTIPRVGVLADDTLASVFRNLVKNAIQHNDETVPEVQLSIENTPDTVSVRVADNGPGIPDDEKPQIFDRGTKGRDSDGTGIGLYLVETLVGQYDGDVWIEDNEPKGTVFVVELDRA
jgi:PAS domain S-box-containing protein